MKSQDWRIKAIQKAIRIFFVFKLRDLNQSRIYYEIYKQLEKVEIRWNRITFIFGKNNIAGVVNHNEINHKCNTVNCPQNVNYKCFLHRYWKTCERYSQIK